MPRANTSTPVRPSPRSLIYRPRSSTSPFRSGTSPCFSPDESAAIKLDSYPQRSWHGVVRIVSPESEPADGDRTFAARVPLANTDATLRSGMTGRAKIFIGYRPAGYVLLRRPALWIWQTLWNWIGW